MSSNSCVILLMKPGELGSTSKSYESICQSSSTPSAPVLRPGCSRSESKPRCSSRSCSASETFAAACGGLGAGGAAAQASRRPLLTSSPLTSVQLPSSRALPLTSHSSQAAPHR